MVTLFEKQKKEARKLVDYWLGHNLSLSDALTRAKKELWGTMVWESVERELAEQEVCSG